MAIKISNNNLISLRKYFQAKLESAFDKQEIDSFFFYGLSYFLGISKLVYHTQPEKKISESDILKFRSLAKELRKNRPLQYIFGECEFYGLTLKVDTNVLIPRPETEEMVADIISKVEDPSVIVDFCTGSGCIALALKSHFSNSLVTGLDVSPEALKVARVNAAVNNLGVKFINDDLLSPKVSIKTIDLIVANPPYVTNSEKSQMKPNVLDYEPKIALFVSDTDPLLFYNAIIKSNVKNLNRNGWVFMEINEKFGAEVLSLLKKSGIKKNLRINNDLNGKPRWVCGQK